MFLLVHYYEVAGIDIGLILVEPAFADATGAGAAASGHYRKFGQEGENYTVFGRVCVVFPPLRAGDFL